MKSNNEYTIPFVGLKTGIHRFEYSINDKFFDSIEYSIVHKGNVNVVLLFEKKENMMIGDYSVKGKVELACNRCNDPVDANINGSYRLIYQFGTEPSNDEALTTVYPDQFEIDIKESILELITVSLPNLAIHEEGECNEEVISVLNEYLIKSKTAEKGTNHVHSDNENDDYIDPRWEALNKLKKRK